MPEDGVVVVVSVMRQPGMGWDDGMGWMRALAGENNPAVIRRGGCQVDVARSRRQYGG